LRFLKIENEVKIRRIDVVRKLSFEEY